VFTARYGLIPYIKQIAFSLQKVKVFLLEAGQCTVPLLYDRA
jgi:hypothetical protein